MLKLIDFIPKHRDSVKLKPIRLDFKRNDLVAVFGRNGAGKSTFFDSLCGVIEPSGGHAQLASVRLSFEEASWRSRFGYLPQRLALPAWSTGKDLIELADKSLNLKLSVAAFQSGIDTWDLSSFYKRPLALLSHGMKKRIGLCLATMHRPEVLVLDEPFSGLDLPQISVLEKVLSKRKAEGVGPTLISSHMMDVVARLANRALFLKGDLLQEVNGWEEFSTLKRIEYAYQLFGVELGSGDHF